ncbi:MAG: nitrous oxide reductase accessory protein NosL [Pseudomonadota bacterium]|nr:nitrous oxide reductase accessory protein NosL [Pseudomonadota bacterium]
MTLPRPHAHAHAHAARRLACLAALLALGACSQAAKNPPAQEIAADTACALDGMMLQDFPGPKGQIQYVEGKPDFYCDLTELFAVLLAPEQKRQVGGLFVQDMGKADWDHPRGNWIAAKTALFVVGSRKSGSMGPTFGAFSTQAAADAFVHQQGGQVVRFEQVTAAMVNARRAGAMHGA